MAVYGFLVIGGAWDDRQQAKALWRIALDLVVGLLLLALALTYWIPVASSALGAAGMPLLGAMLCWDIYSAGRELARLQHDPELSPRENEGIQWVGIAFMALLMGPLYLLAWLSVSRGPA